LTPKEHHISRWQIDPLADPKGQFGYRVAFFNLRGQHGNPMTSARLFNPHFDDEDFAVAVAYLHTLYPEAPFIAFAYSFGGPVIAK
jgi:predicted alpha/beta-fold hydrolase